MPLDAEFRIDVINAYEALNQALSNLEHAINNDQHLPSWIEGNPSAPRQSSYQAIGQLEYLSDQPPKETLICAGLIAASPQTLDCVKQVNEAKVQFKQAMLALKAAKITVHDPALVSHFESHLQTRSKGTRSHLQKMGLARLHLKQCYRKIPLLEERPNKISWTWAHTRAIKRISAADCITLLQKKWQRPWYFTTIRKGTKAPLRYTFSHCPRARPTFTRQYCVL
ncbi:DNA replication terminus site-binding protein [Piscirickettsia litoralis]|uniref:DNA replication terminus site-binding protein n=1 Tax=Piscirickettsia litoralis TaxID=1891921 RepID=UPI000A944F35|nr:DNA replication terminus site-binding protein [Piscirickettsia litoralis]